MLGITVRSVRLMIWPLARLHETLTRTRPHQVGIMLQAEQLDIILNALTQQPDEQKTSWLNPCHAEPD